MSWRAKYLAEIERRDAQTAQLAIYFDTFAIAAERAALVDRKEPRQDLASSQLLPPPPTPEVAAREDLIAALRDKLQRTTRQLEVTGQQLDASQRRAREMVEEQYMKTKSVQDLYDEVLALTMQLNLSEERANILRQENAELAKARE